MNIRCNDMNDEIWMMRWRYDGMFMGYDLRDGIFCDTTLHIGIGFLDGAAGMPFVWLLRLRWNFLSFS